MSDTAIPAVPVVAAAPVVAPAAAPVAVAPAPVLAPPLPVVAAPVVPASVAAAPSLSAAQIASLQAQAAQWEAHQLAETNRIAAVRAALLPHQQAAVDAAQTLDGKRVVLAMIDADKAALVAAKPELRPAVSGVPGAPNVPTDFSKIADRTALQVARTADPAGWEAFKASIRGPAQRQPTTFELRRAAQQATQKKA